jgi:hypothetical protein
MTQVDDGVEQDDAEGARVERRRFLRRGAITAAVAAAGVAAIARPAGAAEGGNIQIGTGGNANNTGTTTTTLSGSQFLALNGNGNVSLVGEHNTSNAVGVEGRSDLGPQLKLTPNSLDLRFSAGDTTHTFAAGSMVTDNNDILWYALENGATSQNGLLHPISLTSAFVPISPPIRQYDSRAGEPPLGVQKGALNGFIGQERTVTLLVDNAPVVAVLTNLTVVNTTGSGFLAMFGADEVWNPSAPFSSMNWFTGGQITANSVTSTVQFSTGDVKVHAGGGGTTDFLVDLVGYWVI